MIKQVVDLRGLKRFKKPAEDSQSTNDLLGHHATPNAKEIFMKLNSTTQYNSRFGERPKPNQDFTILNERPFARLQIAQVLKPNIAQMLSRWLTINDQDKFTGRIFYTVREMFTVIKNQLAEVPTSQDQHSKHVELEARPPRFDKMITDLSTKKRQHASQMHREKLMKSDMPLNRRTQSYFEGVDFKIGSRHNDNVKGRLDPKNIYLGPPMIDTKGFKLDFLKGDKDVVMYCDKVPFPSSYQSTLKGIQVPSEQQATILDNQHTSYVQHTIPDPALMTQTQNRFNSIEKDRFNMTQKTNMDGTGFTYRVQEPMIRGGVAGEWRRKSQQPPAEPYTRMQNF